MTTSDNSVAFVGLNSANVRIDNLSNPQRPFDVQANVDIENNTVDNFNGDVYKDGVYIARFNCHNAFENANNLSVNFQNIDASQQGAILEYLHDFIRDTRTLVSERCANILPLTTEQ